MKRPVITNPDVSLVGVFCYGGQKETIKQFFTWIMIKIKKPFILILIAVFLFSNFAYGIEPGYKSCLRVPINKDTLKRVEAVAIHESGELSLASRKDKFEAYLRAEKPEEFILSDIIRRFGLETKDAINVLIKIKYDVGEYLEVIDERGNTTGRLKQRSSIHRDGDWHRTVHVLIFNKKGEMLRTIRGAKARTSKGLFDISSAGHISIGSWKDTAYEEIREEVAISADEISNLMIVNEENGFIKIGEPNEEPGFDEKGAYHYSAENTNREFSTLCIAVTDLTAENINRRLRDQVDPRPVESADFVLISKIGNLVKEKYSSTFRQYFLNRETLRAILKGRNFL
ncbi:MAG: hypothetical protein Q7O04_08065 [Candidatus Omnitrophota bacterium]|nr:hypothetical protein [Candidatus Omnitrophota bacterium]